MEVQLSVDAIPVCDMYTVWLRVRSITCRRLYCKVGDAVVAIYPVSLPTCLRFCHFNAEVQ